MPHRRLSLPPPAAPTSPLRLHRSSSPHCHRLAITPSLDVELQSRHPSPSIAVHHRPSPCRPSPPSRHHAILIHPSPLQPQSIVIALTLCLTVHRHYLCDHSPSPSLSQSRCPSLYCRRGAAASSIAVEEPSRSPLTSHRSVH